MTSNNGFFKKSGIAMIQRELDESIGYPADSDNGAGYNVTVPRVVASDVVRDKKKTQFHIPNINFHMPDMKNVRNNIGKNTVAAVEKAIGTVKSNKEMAVTIASIAAIIAMAGGVTAVSASEFTSFHSTYDAAITRLVNSRDGLNKAVRDSEKAADVDESSLPTVYAMAVSNLDNYRKDAGKLTKEADKAIAEKSQNAVIVRADINALNNKASRMDALSANINKAVGDVNSGVLMVQMKTDKEGLSKSIDVAKNMMTASNGHVKDENTRNNLSKAIDEARRVLDSNAYDSIPASIEQLRTAVGAVNASMKAYDADAVAKADQAVHVPYVAVQHFAPAVIPSEPVQQPTQSVEATVNQKPSVPGNGGNAGAPQHGNNGSSTNAGSNGSNQNPSVPANPDTDNKPSVTPSIPGSDTDNGGTVDKPVNGGDTDSGKVVDYKYMGVCDSVEECLVALDKAGENQVYAFTTEDGSVYYEIHGEKGGALVLKKTSISIDGHVYKLGTWKQAELDADGKPLAAKETGKYVQTSDAEGHVWYAMILDK